MAGLIVELKLTEAPYNNTALSSARSRCVIEQYARFTSNSRFLLLVGLRSSPSGR